MSERHHFGAPRDLGRHKFGGPEPVVRRRVAAPSKGPVSGDVRIWDDAVGDYRYVYADDPKPTLPAAAPLNQGQNASDQPKP